MLKEELARAAPAEQAALAELEARVKTESI